MVKVSIIIPAYNAAATLNRAVQSVLKQTLNDFEILIVNR
ncbi:putative glycosyl transferase [Lacticaseibacillus paracasei]|nr:putative glycosyl transferase [Lacticaseibacillus paracasei]